MNWDDWPVISIPSPLFLSIMKKTVNNGLRTFPTNCGLRWLFYGGEIEVLQDDIRSADCKALDSLHTEILQLSRLVDDLYQLSLLDVGALTYHKEPVDPFGIVRQAAESFRDEFNLKGISLSLKLPPASTSGQIFADPERFHQLFANLFDNNLKYTHPEGKVEILGHYRQGQCHITLRDSAPGVPTTDYARLFERLYRVEASRNRNTGGMGLGLTICQNIIKAHEGTIAAGPSPLVRPAGRYHHSTD